MILFSVSHSADLDLSMPLGMRMLREWALDINAMWMQLGKRVRI